MRRWTLVTGLFAALSCAVSAQDEAGRFKLGEYGQFLQPATIYARPSSRSQAYYRAQQFEYIVVRDAPQADWYLVPLEQGGWGFVKRQFVAKLPYVATIDESYRSLFENTPGGRDTGTMASRGGRSAIADMSLRYIGTPYKWGGNDLNGGIDCSGFVKQLYGKIGVSLPRTAAEQAMVGSPIARLEDLQAGDRLYFWDSKRGKIGHTGIYLGNGYFSHSSSGQKGVATDYLGAAHWRKILVAARR
ncbi:MAG: C40 family peptidase [Fimbriimonadaceae bacterium]|nr:C40 family peptidase [Fimbriimonadaceae bacterium]